MRRIHPLSSFSACLSVAALLCSRNASPADANTPDKDVCIHSAEDGQHLRSTRKLVEARERLIACARDVCPALVRKDCAQWLSEVEVTVPTVVFGAKNGRGEDVIDVRVTVDGSPVTDRLDGSAIPVDPGPHSFRFEGSGYAPVEQQATIREGEKSRLLTVVFPNAPSGPIPTGFWIFGGVGVLGGAGFAVLAALGEHDISNLRSTCAPSCAASSVDSARTKIIVANVSLGVGIAAVAVAAGFLIWRSPEGKTAAFSVAPTVGGGTASLSASF